MGQATHRESKNVAQIAASRNIFVKPIIDTKTLFYAHKRKEYTKARLSPELKVFSHGKVIFSAEKYPECLQINTVIDSQTDQWIKKYAGPLPTIAKR